MPHGLDLIEPEQTAVPTVGPAGPVERIIAAVNQLIVIVSSVALLGASLVLTYSVIFRYFLKFSTDWRHECSVDRPALRRRAAAGDVRRHADRVRARRGRHRVHDLLHARSLGRYHHPECLRGDGVDHAALDPAVHPQGLGDRPLTRRPGSLWRAACLDASPARRTRHRQHLRLRAVRGDGWFFTGDVLGDRLRRYPGN